MNETVATLAEESEEHRSEMATYHTETETKLDDLQTSLQSVDTRVLLLLLPYLNDIEHDIKTELGQMIEENGESLSEEMKEHRNQTALELADIQSSLQFACQKLIVYLHRLQSTLVTGMIQGFNTTSSELTSHDTKLDSLNTQIAGHFNDVRTQLSVVNNEICDKIEDHERHMESELDDLESTLSNQTNQGFTSLDCATSSELTSHDTKLDSSNTQINDDVNDIRSELSIMSDKIDDHDHKTDNKLLDIVSLHQNRNDSCYTCGGTGGWRHAVYLDMTDNNTNCPPGWQLTGYSKRTCGKASYGQDICDSVFFPVSEEYSQVCGRIKAYQWGWTAGFWGYRNGRSSINESYFCGVAVMHGSPRQHIWTFAAGAAEGDPRSYYSHCPCDTSLNIPIPPYVGNDYFCESGYIYVPGSTPSFMFHPDDPLWDGDGCISTSTCCSLNNPPTFTKTLATPTTDDLELRMCIPEAYNFRNIAVELVDLYVK